jgi:Fe-S-cluster containining protein
MSTMSPTMRDEDPHRASLLALYAEVDSLLAPFSCDGTTECCRFGITGREPYPTAVEIALVKHAIARAGITLSTPPRNKRALPVLGGASSASPRRDAEAGSERACPLLSAEGRCRVYAARPFGCRTFFCDRVEGPGKLPRREIQRISRAIADLSARFAPQDPLPRPLTRALCSPPRRHTKA